MDEINKITDDLLRRLAASFNKKEIEGRPAKNLQLEIDEYKKFAKQRSGKKANTSLSDYMSGAKGMPESDIVAALTEYIDQMDTPSDTLRLHRMSLIHHATISQGAKAGLLARLEEKLEGMKAFVPARPNQAKEIAAALKVALAKIRGAKNLIELNNTYASIQRSSFKLFNDGDLNLIEAEMSLRRKALGK